MPHEITEFDLKGEECRLLAEMSFKIEDRDRWLRLSAKWDELANRRRGDGKPIFTPASKNAA